jgi:hypothetical protein
VAVVVLDILVDDSIEMSTAKDQHPVQTFAADSADEAFSEGVGLRRPNRSTDGPNAIGAEDLVEAGGELGVAIADQECDRLSALASS